MKTVNSILVLDDDASLGEFIVAAAENVGLRCGFTTDATSFLEQLTPDVSLVLVDLVMPHIDGVEMLRFLAQKGCDANVVLMSGLGTRVIQTAEHLADTLGLSVIGHLQKPIRLVDLEAVFAMPRLSKVGKPQPVATELVISGEDLRNAVERREFVNCYQPQICADTGDVIGVEALVRWMHPIHGIVFPDAFIVGLERMNLIAELGWIVTRQAFSDIKHFADDSGISPKVSINFPIDSFQDLMFPDRFAALAIEYEINPANVTLEITESSLVRGLSTTLDVLTRLRMKQFELSIDDFGTGYSMMQQLKTIPATELKIDKSFVLNLHSNESDRIVVIKSIEIGHGLGMRAVAEGVETVEQLDFLRSNGCDVLQGYLFSRPLSVKDLVTWLKNHRSMQLLPSPTSIINTTRS